MDATPAVPLRHEPFARRGLGTFLRDSWRLSGQALELVRRTPALTRLLAAGALFLALLLDAFAVTGALLSEGLEIEITTTLAAVELWFLAWISTSLSIGVAGIADRALRGESPSVADGLRLARARAGLAAAWAVVLVLVSIPARLVTRWTVDQLGAVLVGFTWNLLSFFAIPAIALDGARPLAAAKRSLRIAAQVWGQTAAGVVSTWLRALLVLGLPGLACAIAGTAIIDGGADIAGWPLLLAGLALIGAAILLGMASTAILSVAIYRYAESGVAPGPFAAEDLGGAGRRPWQPVVWLCSKVEGERVRRMRAWVAEHARS